MKLTWCTDTHLNFCSTATIEAFCIELNQSDGDIIALTGDISEGSILEEHLNFLATRLNKDIYFVLGNHDYYCS